MQCPVLLSGEVHVEFLVQVLVLVLVLVLVASWEVPKRNNT